MTRLLTVLLALALGTAAQAATREAGQDSGSLQFIATQADAKFAGAFRQFHVKLDFDPARPQTGSLDVTVETASIDTQDAERDEILRGPDFFWVEKHPQASFHAIRFERAGPGWSAKGELTIRGVTKTVPVEFTLTPAGGVTVMKGSARLERLAFGLGQGDWASTEWVGNEIDVRFELRFLPVG
ncbi:MAG: YceI family protein [Steroidobacteraceae bacterium]